MIEIVKELKIRIGNYQEVEKKLLELGANFIQEDTYEYTYFNQPEGKVLKVTTNGNSSYISRLEREDDNFKILPDESIEDPAQKISELKAKFGIKRNLVNKRRFFSYKNNSITTNQIEGVGQFLIIEAEKPELDLAIQITGTQKPGIITDSFDSL